MIEHRQASGDEQISVIVCTRNRAVQLRGCLESLRGVDYPRLNFLIVDNAPSDQSAREVIESVAAVDSRFRYVAEDRAGLSRARNRGLALAEGQIVAFVDDDVRVPSDWLEGMMLGFRRRPDVACVTGPVASAAVEQATERYFERRVRWSVGSETRVFDRSSGPGAPALHPYAAGAFGVGANMAFRAEALRAVGGFDEALGAGSPSAGGEDLDIFVRMIRAGYAICQEPAAAALHEHRADLDDLRKQMRDYGKGLAAYLCKYLTSPATAFDLIRRLPQGMRHMGVLSARSRQASDETGLPRTLWLAEMRGLLEGPWAYLGARRRQDRSNRAAVAP